MKRPLNSRAVRISFGISMSVLAWISIASYWSTHALVDSFDTVARGHKAIGKFQHIETMMEHILSDVQVAEFTGLDLRWQNASEHSLRTKGFLALATLVSLAVLGWIYGLLRRETAGRRQAESAQGQTETFMRSIIERIPYM